MLLAQGAQDVNPAEQPVGEILCQLLLDCLCLGEKIPRWLRMQFQ